MTGQRLTVWYNTRCPVCNGGIDWQRNKLLAAVRAGRILFKDINEQPDALASYGASLDDVRRRLHATDETGRLIVGADVAVAIWRVTKGEGEHSLINQRNTRFGVGDRFARAIGNRQRIADRATGSVVGRAVFDDGEINILAEA